MYRPNYVIYQFKINFWKLKKICMTNNQDFYRIKHINCTFFEICLDIGGSLLEVSGKICVATRLFAHHSWFTKDPYETKMFEQNLWKFRYYHNCPAIFYKIFPALF